MTSKKKDERKKICERKDIIYTTDGNFVYAEIPDVDDEIKLEMFTDNYYKLKYLDGNIILEIDGVRMHLVKEFDSPQDYAETIIDNFRSKKATTILDTCTGLGYTAIKASELGEVITIEKSDAVITLAKWNPYSDELWSDNINLINGNVTEVIKHFEDNMFSHIIHDPPVRSKAPGLYSERFYEDLYRVCENNGELFHYTGRTKKSREQKIHKTVANKLKKVGFRRPNHNKRLKGLYVSRP